MNARQSLYLLPLVPTLFAVTALYYKKRYQKNNLFLTEAVAASCAIICILIHLLSSTGGNAVWFLVASFFFSINGDLAMKRRTGKKDSDKDFALGIFFFLLAHFGYLSYALTKVRFSWPIFVVLVIPFIIAYVVILYFRIYLPKGGLKGKETVATFVFVYLMISCLSLSASIDLHGGSVARWVYTAAIASLFISDAFIAFREFLKRKRIMPFIMPLYYLCHILIALSFIMEYMGTIIL